MRAASWCLLAVLFVLGCGGGGDDTGDDNNGVMLGDAGQNECEDNDGDYFGRYCPDGRDCDDNDPSITDECIRCATPNKGCPCEVGTKPMECKPADMKVTQNGVMGTIVCEQGARYCRDGIYSDCEVLLQYATFVPDE